MMCRRLCVVIMFCFYGFLFCSEGVDKKGTAYPKSFSENDKKWLKNMDEFLKRMPKGASNINLKFQICDNMKKTTSDKWIMFGAASIAWGVLLYSISLPQKN